MYNVCKRNNLTDEVKQMNSYFKEYSNTTNLNTSTWTGSLLELVTRLPVGHLLHRPGWRAGEGLWWQLSVKPHSKSWVPPTQIKHINS